MNNKHAVRKKIFTKYGLTLSEMLVAVLLLSLMSLAVSSGMGITGKIYNNEKSYSESRVLSDSVFSVLSDELRYAVDPSWNDSNNSIDYESMIYGKDTSLYVVDDSESDKRGHLVISYDGQAGMELISDKTYGGLMLKNFECIVEDGDYVSVSFDIANKDDNVLASVSNKYIRLINQADALVVDAGETESSGGILPTEPSSEPETTAPETSKEEIQENYFIADNKKFYETINWKEIEKNGLENGNSSWPYKQIDYGSIIKGSDNYFYLVISTQPFPYGEGDISELFLNEKYSQYLVKIIINEVDRWDAEKTIQYSDHIKTGAWDWAPKPGNICLYEGAYYIIKRTDTSDIYFETQKPTDGDNFIKIVPSDS